jgi:hypothetical protein
MIDELVRRFGTRPFANRRVRLFIYVVAEIWIVTAALAYFGGTGSGTASGSVTTLSAPAAPAASASGTTATVTWTASTIGGTVAATSYTVERYSSGGTDLGTAACSPVSSGSGSPNAFGSFTCADHPVAGAYKYRVTGIYHSSWTAPSSFTSNVIVQNQTGISASGPTTDPTSTAIPASSISATLSGAGGGAGGTITLKVFGPQASAPTTCTSAGTTVGTATVSGNGTYSPSAGYTPSSAGTYWWYASYAGDTNNSSSASTCASGMVSTVVKNATTTASGSAPSSGTAGTGIAGSSVTSTLSGATGGAAGTLTYTVFGPQASAPTTCTSGGTTVGTASVSGNGTYNPSTGYTPTAAGTYWWYASYGGDGSNSSSASTCGSGMPSTSVAKASPTLSAAAPTTDPTGTAIAAGSISATLSGSSGGSGTVTFTVFGPQASAPTTCTSGGTTVGTAAVSGNAAYNPSAGFTPSTAGTYWWYASYNGDANNNAAMSTCGSGMSSTVVKNTTTATASVPATGTSGTAISASSIGSVLSGATAGAGGTITYTVFGPQATAPSTCTSGGTTVGTATVSGNATFHPDLGYTPSSAGTYWWYASYNGDASNSASNSGCGSGMTSTYVWSVSSAASGTSTSGTSVTTSSFTVQPSTTYLLLVFRHSSASDSVSSLSSSGLSPSLTLSSFTSVSSQTYNSIDYQWAYWITTASNASGTGTLTVNFANTLAGGQISIVDLIALGGNSTTNPIVIGNTTATSGSGTSATANLTYAPGSVDSSLVFLSSNKGLGASAPAASPAMTNAFYSQQGPGSIGTYTVTPGSQNESFTITSSPWGAIVVELRRTGSANTTTSTVGAPSTGTAGTVIGGSSISSTLSGATSGAGNGVTFTVFGPQASAPTDCSSGGTTVGTATVSGNGSYASSAGFTPTQAGTYWWYATYSGDQNNIYSASTCGSSMASTAVAKAATTTSASAPSAGLTGTAISASSISATLSGGVSSPAGTITYTVFGPQASAPTTCTSGGTTVGTATVSGNGTYNSSASFTPSTVGTYWWYASYGGDSNNSASNSTCGSGMASTYLYSATSAASVTDTALANNSTTSSFTVQTSTTYLLLVYRSKSGSSDSITSLSSTGLSPALSLGSFTSIISQSFNNKDYEWAYWITTSGSASGTGTLKINFNNTLGSGQVTIIDLIQLGGVSTTVPVVTGNEVTSTANSGAATANLPSAPSSGDLGLVFLGSEKGLGATTPAPSPAMTSLFYSQQGAGSMAPYVAAPGAQNESITLTAGFWGTIGLELTHP